MAMDFQMSNEAQGFLLAFTPRQVEHQGRPWQEDYDP